MSMLEGKTVWTVCVTWRWVAMVPVRMRCPHSGHCGSQPRLAHSPPWARLTVRLARGSWPGERSSLYIVARNPAGHLLQVLGGELHGGEVDVGDARAPLAQLPVTQAEDVGEGETGGK